MPHSGAGHVTITFDLLVRPSGDVDAVHGIVDRDARLDLSWRISLLHFYTWQLSHRPAYPIPGMLASLRRALQERSPAKDVCRATDQAQRMRRPRQFRPGNLREREASHVSRRAPCGCSRSGCGSGWSKGSYTLHKPSYDDGKCIPLTSDIVR